MHSRWYEIAVVLLWLTSMGWLIARKVLPTLLVGDPPDAASMLETRRPNVPVGWQVAWNDRSLGWALSNTVRQPDGSTKVRSVVHFDELPLGEIIPAVFKTLLPELKELGTQYGMETQSILVFTPAGRIRGFDSTVRFDPVHNAIEIHGVIEGTLLSLSLRAGDIPYETQMRMPQKEMLHDAISPEINLPGLHEGQTWTVKSYSPLRPPTSPMEVLQARVEGSEEIAWNGRLVDVWRVTYRPDSGAVLRRSDRPRSELWVARDGTVLKQQSSILNSLVSFVRLSDREAAELAETVNDPQMLFDTVRGM